MKKDCGCPCRGCGKRKIEPRCHTTCETFICWQEVRRKAEMQKRADCAALSEMGAQYRRMTRLPKR